MVWREKKIFNGSNLVISDEFLNLVYFYNVWLFNIICCRIRLISLFQIIGIRVWSNKNPNKNRTREVGPNKQCSFVSLLRLTQLRIFHKIFQWRKYLGELRGKSVYLFVCACKCICIYEKIVCAFMFVCVFVGRIVRSLCVFVNRLQRLHKHPHLLITSCKWVTDSQSDVSCMWCELHSSYKVPWWRLENLEWKSKTKNMCLAKNWRENEDIETFKVKILVRQLLLEYLTIINCWFLNSNKWHPVLPINSQNSDAS